MEAAVIDNLGGGDHLAGFLAEDVKTDRCWGEDMWLITESHSMDPQRGGGRRKLWR